MVYVKCKKSAQNKSLRQNLNSADSSIAVNELYQSVTTEVLATLFRPILPPPVSTPSHLSTRPPFLPASHAPPAGTPALTSASRPPLPPAVRTSPRPPVGPAAPIPKLHIQVPTYPLTPSLPATPEPRLLSVYPPLSSPPFPAIPVFSRPYLPSRSPLPSLLPTPESSRGSGAYSALPSLPIPTRTYLLTPSLPLKYREAHFLPYMSRHESRSSVYASPPSLPGPRIPPLMPRAGCASHARAGAVHSCASHPGST
ncbi:hypothetical protein C8J57DRAFT_1549583 [Mycena rebaudengoi]|nr:hypothetical protein C8J57DRAFT_1549583 [Mycena rebaudengoi]